ncbi:uncharacterized protein EAE98_009835 [Botrytis deweyae]|uniref:Uncharacterized protein n=1 Tax=Botrytis deweyae TaxID=2478750 RepID=A0ABQ7IB27_9HELO|nr:uncharacterized protein EAE98_009835 [Botrytis deweyae]KAF7918223.1 hypothetical protein EAE98_009835 [Botrytis deweyae]
MASQSPLLLGLNRRRWTLNLLRGTIQELVRENYRIEIHQPGETRPVLMRRLDDLLHGLSPETVNMLTERHRQRNWRQEDIVRYSHAARPIARRVVRCRCAAVRANGVQPRIRSNLRNSELSIDAQAARNSQILRAVSGLTDEWRRRILELEAANNGLMTQVSEFLEAEARRGIEAEARRGIEADELRGRNLQLEMANTELTTKLRELERAATAQEIEKLILKDRTENLEATLAPRNRRVSMLEAPIIHM